MNIFNRSKKETISHEDICKRIETSNEILTSRFDKIYNTIIDLKKDILDLELKLKESKKTGMGKRGWPKGKKRGPRKEYRWI